MKPTPEGWPRISSSVFYQDGHAAIDWLCRAFDFEVRLLVEGEDGRLEHSELVYGEGVIMVGEQGKDERLDQALMVSPKSVNGGNTHSLFVYVDDVDAHYARAREAGAEITRELATQDYGAEYWSDRGYGAKDLEGHLWYFAQRVR